MALLWERVEALFRGHPSTQIDFSYDGQHVNGAKFGKVADAIKKGTIGVQVGDTGAHLSSGYGQGKPTRRRELEADYPEGRAGVVHEGVHAWADLDEPQESALGQVHGLRDRSSLIPGRSTAACPDIPSMKMPTRLRRPMAWPRNTASREDCESLRSASHAVQAYQDLPAD